MHEELKKVPSKRVDIKELEFPETVFIRDIENRVFQSIVLQCLSKIPDVGLIEGTMIDSLLGREESVKGIQAEQDQKNHSIAIRIEVNIAYGVSIPEKAEEIQSEVTEELTRLTGLHVASVHVVFKNIIPPQRTAKQGEPPASSSTPTETLEEEYSDEFK